MRYHFYYEVSKILKGEKSRATKDTSNMFSQTSLVTVWITMKF